MPDPSLVPFVSTPWYQDKRYKRYKRYKLTDAYGSALANEL
jgi:hypothetical protein